MQGVGARPAHSLERRGGVSPWLAPMSGLSEMQLKLVCGNGIHVPVFAAVLLYILGNCCTRECVSRRSLCKTPPLRVDAADAEDSQTAEQDIDETETMLCGLPRACG